MTQFITYKRHTHVTGYPYITIRARSGKIWFHYVHHIVWSQAHGPIPDDMHIHHKDFDRSNYALDNLEGLTKHEHAMVHRHANPNWELRRDVWHRKCKDCGRFKPKDDFGTYPKGWWRNVCRPCSSLATKRYRLAKSSS